MEQPLFLESQEGLPSSFRPVQEHAHFSLHLEGLMPSLHDKTRASTAVVATHRVTIMRAIATIVATIVMSFSKRCVQYVTRVKH